MNKFFSATLSVFMMLCCVTLFHQEMKAQTREAATKSQEESAAASNDLVVAEGAVAKLSLQTQLSSKLSEVGDQVTAIVYEPVRDKDGNVAIPRGTEFYGRVTQVQAAKRPQKQATLTLVFDRMRMAYGEEKVSVTITAIDDYGNDRKLKSQNDEGKVGGGKAGGRTVENAGKGAGLGSLGGLIGIAAGGGIGTLATAVGVGAAGGVLMTKGNDIKLEPGTILRIRFERPLTVPAFDK